MLTKEHKENISKGLTGRKVSKETKLKIRMALLGVEKSKEAVEKNRLSHIGKKVTAETRLKMSLSLKGREITEKWRRKISLANKGKPSPLKGKKLTKETRLKMSLSKIGKPQPWNAKEKCTFWRGGVSFGEYDERWTNALRNSVRKRDKFTCQACGTKQEKRKLDVHHIDYNKLNCKKINLITLCQSCHRRTNANRKHWINYFSNIWNHQSDKEVISPA